MIQDEISGTLSTVNNQSLVCMTDTQKNTSVDTEVSGTISANTRKDPPVVAFKHHQGTTDGSGADESEPIAGYHNCQEMTTRPINTMIATRGNKLGRGTGFGLGDEHDPAYTLTCNHEHGVEIENGIETVVRRLTPLECERLQGFPDNHTRIPWKGKSADECPDGPRYKAIGNSMAVPVMRWLGERIEAADRI